MKKTILQCLCFFSLFFSGFAFSIPISFEGQKLAVFLDSLHVKQHWLRNKNVYWLTGKIKGSWPGATHCSFFVAAVAARLGIYILRPPQHNEILLSNAQRSWLRSEGAAYGWWRVKTAIRAQREANRGCLVVAAYDNPFADQPGHIAVIRPNNKTLSDIERTGPQIIQAGFHNYNTATLQKGFARHPGAFRNKNILFYGHSTKNCRL